MRAAGQLVRDTFDNLEVDIRDGITTCELNKLAHDFIIQRGGYPAPLGYHPPGYAIPFPKSICASINSVAAHGVPSSRDLIMDGDIISIDISLSLDGHYADACRTYTVGNVPQEVEDFVDLCRITHSLLIDYLDDNIGKITTADIGRKTLQLAEAYDIYPIVGLGGHGIGRELHLEPFVPPSPIEGQGVLLERGMYITIEPIFTMAPASIRMAPDQWSIVCPCGTLSAQFEHTLYLGPRGVEILT